MTETKYKCHTHEPNDKILSLCLSCLWAMKHQRDALLEHVKQLSYPLITKKEVSVMTHGINAKELILDARKLLKEIGEA